MLEPDLLLRLLVLPAVAALGFVPAAGPDAGGADAPAAVFVPLERTPDCRRARSEALRAVGPPAVPPLLVGYGAGGEALLSAHRAHRCCDLVLRLTAGAGGEPALGHLPAHDAVAAGLSPREADVLVLLLQGHTTPAIAARLCVAESTARSHCRAVLRKAGVPDRRTLRAVASPGAGWPLHVPRGAAGANFAEESPVAPSPPAAHT